MGRQTLISHPSFTEERTLFDPVGCLLERTIDGCHESFSYDYLCQLTSDNGRSARYDSLHRRVETEGKAAVHNSLNQITSQGDLRYTYDRDGRCISDGSHRYTYDALDRLIRAEDDSTRYDYAYDPFNRRLSTTTSVRSEDGWQQKKVERYLWQGDCEVGSVDGQGNTLSLRVLGEGLGAEIGSAVLVEVGGETYVPLHDLCGHVRVLLSLDAKEAERLTYTAYGLSSRSSNITPWTFSSKRQDPTGLVYFGQRFYDPETATWMTLDPLGNSAGPNLYAYVKNNPLTCFDQHGLFGESFGSVVSDLVDTVCDAFGAVVDFVCDVFSGIANAFSGWGGSGEDWSPSFSEHASGYSAKRVERTLSYAKRSPQTPFQRDVEKLFLTQILIHPFGSVEEFVKANAGSNLKEKVFVEIPGANTTLREAVERAEMFVAKNQSSCSAVVILYNSTQGVLKDLFEATLNSLGFDLPVGTALRDGFIDFLQQCQQNDIHFEATFICHSQGVSIGDNIIHSQAFSGNPSTCKYFGGMLNLGGPKIVPGAINCVAVGDPVSLLSLINLPAVANAAWNGELHFFLPTNVEFPHNYCGSAYQQAIQTYAGSS